MIINTSVYGSVHTIFASAAGATAAASVFILCS